MARSKALWMSILALISVGSHPPVGSLTGIRSVDGMLSYACQTSAFGTLQGPLDEILSLKYLFFKADRVLILLLGFLLMLDQFDWLAAELQSDLCLRQAPKPCGCSLG